MQSYNRDPFNPFILFLGVAGFLLLLARCTSVKEMGKAADQEYTGSPWAIEVYPQRKEIYWLRSHYDDTNSQIVYRTTYDGDSTEMIVGPPESPSSEEVNVLDIALDEKRGHLYWSNQESEIRYSDLDGSDEGIVYKRAPHPARIALDSQNGVLYWMTTRRSPSHCRSTWMGTVGGEGCEGVGLVRRASIRFDNGTPSLENRPVKTIATIDYLHPQTLLGRNALEVDSLTQQVFYSGLRSLSEGSVYRVSPDGESNFFVEAFDRGVGDLGGTFARRVGFAVAPKEEVLYLAKSLNERIVEVPFEGANEGPAPVVEAEDPTDIAIDPQHSTIYWTDRALVDDEVAAGIYRANVDGSGKTLVFPDSLVESSSAQEVIVR